MRERCNRFRANRLDTYSRADVSCGSSCFASRRDWPASKGEEIRSALSEVMMNEAAVMDTKTCRLRGRRKGKRETSFREPMGYSDEDWQLSSHID